MTAYACIDAGWRLRFAPCSRGVPVRSTFPATSNGQVDLDAFDDEQRQAYFSARILRGLHHSPRVIRTDEH